MAKKQQQQQQQQQKKTTGDKGVSVCRCETVNRDCGCTWGSSCGLAMSRENFGYFLFFLFFLFFYLLFFYLLFFYLFCFNNCYCIYTKSVAWFSFDILSLSHKNYIYTHIHKHLHIYIYIYIPTKANYQVYRPLDTSIYSCISSN